MRSVLLYAYTAMLIVWIAGGMLLLAWRLTEHHGGRIALLAMSSLTTLVLVSTDASPVVLAMSLGSVAILAHTAISLRGDA